MTAAKCISPASILVSNAYGFLSASRLIAPRTTVSQAADFYRNHHTSVLEKILQADLFSKMNIFDTQLFFGVGSASLSGTFLEVRKAFFEKAPLEVGAFVNLRASLYFGGLANFMEAYEANVEVGVDSTNAAFASPIL